MASDRCLQGVPECIWQMAVVFFCALITCEEARKPIKAAVRAVADNFVMMI